MKKYGEILFYVLTVLVLTSVIYFVITRGQAHQPVEISALQQQNSSPVDQFRTTWMHNLMHPLAILLLQIITIILAARLFGFICKKLKQPTVIGEIAAGIVLGPSLVGTILPEFSTFLFPQASLSNLQFLSQIGLILFMFVIGMELDMKVLKNRAKDAVIISHASIILPFTLGVVLAYYIYGSFAPEGISFLAFALFIGIAMSITAFPVLARIVQEKGLSKTKLGTIAITCAAADDITAWCLLAAVIAIVKAGSLVSAFFIILMAAVYVLFMLFIARPFLKRLGDKYANREGLSKPVVAVFFITLLLSSYVTEVIGVHALFGAFMAGVIMPTNVRFRNLFIEKVEDVALVLLLPLFFVFTGLRTQIGLLDSGDLWATCGLIVLVAVAGKFLGSAMAAKIVGQTWRESLIIGALMNTRGLVELVVLNIGYDLGVLSPEIFAMLVIMALVTTVMTAPALYIINRIFAGKIPVLQVPSMSEADKFNVLVSFGSPEKGVSLLRIAHALVRQSGHEASVTAMHLSPSNEINQHNFLEFEKESFRPIRSEAKKLKTSVNLFFKPSQDIEGEIVQTANQGNFSLLLIGIGKSVFEGTLLGNVIGYTSRVLNPGRLFGAVTGKEKLFEKTLFDEKVAHIVKGSKLDVGILVDQDVEKVENIIIPFYSERDEVTLSYAKRFVINNNATVTISDPGNVLSANPQVAGAVSSITAELNGKVIFDPQLKIDKKSLARYDLMLVSIQGWKKIVAGNFRWINNSPSVLIIKS
jgi:Kef-type K+ transport system membrane component KefB